MAKKVIIIGGGVAGMSAAHELVERGFLVELYDRNPEYVGGKARSVNVPGTNLSGSNYLPGEHGFRFFPGFYKHITDTMKRIPYKGKSCFSNLVTTQTVEILQTGKTPILLPMDVPTSPLSWFNAIKDLVETFREVNTELTSAEASFFILRIWQLMTSCEERYLNEYEQIGWWEYLRAEDFGPAYRSLLVEGLTRSLVAAKAHKASTRTVGTIFLQLIYDMMDARTKDTDRVLNGPTSDVWLNPWLAYLKAKGAKYFLGREAVKILMKGDKVAGVTVKNTETQELQTITGDYYLLATPVEVAATLINPDMLKADASLQNIIELAPNVEWMNGMQFYLTKRFDMHKGHTIYANSNWALTSVSQVQFWGSYPISQKYDGTVKGILSVDISDWETPGNFNGKAAEDCTIEEVKEEVWLQLKQAINTGPVPLLTDDMKRFVYLDSNIYVNEKPATPLMLNVLSEGATKKVELLSNKEPLLVNQTNTWTLRPNAYTGIDNLFLASDYVKTYTDLATMEGANEAARRAVNNIIKRSGSSASLCELWELDSPLVLDVIKLADKKRFDQGLAWKNPFSK